MSKQIFRYVNVKILLEGWCLQQYLQFIVFFVLIYLLDWKCADLMFFSFRGKTCTPKKSGTQFVKACQTS